MGKPKLYMFGISPSCQRVFAAMANKGLEYDTFEVDIGQPVRPDEFTQISPFGKVPVLEHDGRIILESANIIQYVDEVWPEPPMMPDTPAERAYARQWIQYSDRELFDRDAEFVHVERNKDRKIEICRSLFDKLVHLETELANKNSLFLGDNLSLVDCMLAPTLANVPVWSKLIDDKKLATYTNIKSYTDRLRAHPVLEKTVFNVPVDVYEGFFSAVLVDGMTFPPDVS